MEAARQIAGSVVDLQHAPVARVGRRLRRVQDGRGIEPYVTRDGDAGGYATALHDGGHIGFGYATETMRSGSDQQRRVGLGNIVKVQAQSDHARQHLERWRDMKRSMLARPRPEAFDIDPLHDGDRPILVPAKSPVGTRRLVKKDGPYRTTRVAQGGSRHSTDGSIAIQKGVQGGNAEQPDPSLISPLPRQGDQDFLQTRSVDGGAMELRAVPLVLQRTFPQLTYRP